MAVDHYENFPVASLLLPRHLRQAVRDIYRYARSADDIADEGHCDQDVERGEVPAAQARTAQRRRGEQDQQHAERATEEQCA
ncbi:MAG: squalene/phytoene synthase family protein, partial [Bordetella sp.]|nr:squalene/phytoene synthase family protein [Bordetella sp.]